MKTISVRNIFEFVIWVVSYVPVVLITGYRSWEAGNSETIKKGWEINDKVNLSIPLVAFVLIAAVSVLLYKITFHFFFKNVKKEIKNDQSIPRLKIKKYKSLSLNEYSFFILSLMLPFVFETLNSIFDLLVLVSLIIILIFTMIKMNQIVVNPIFLFSGVKILEAEIAKGHDLKHIKCAIVTDLTDEQLETEDFFSYSEYFNNVFFLTLK